MTFIQIGIFTSYNSIKIQENPRMGIANATNLKFAKIVARNKLRLKGQLARI